MMHVVVTSYNEPKATVRVVRQLLGQMGRADKLTVIDPFPEVEEYLLKEVKDKRVDFFLDPGEGKALALNWFFQEQGTGRKSDLWVLTDGDVEIGDGALAALRKAFADKKVGAATGRPVALHKKRGMTEWWSWVAFAGVHKARLRLSKQKKFLECSGYLFALRQGVVHEFPTGTSEDSILPWLFWKEGYKVKYVPEAEVFVTNPRNWKDYAEQKVRNIKSHEQLNKIAPDMVRTKSFSTEVREGALFAIRQAESVKEFGWVVLFYGARLWIYLQAFWELRSGRKYSDGWRETEIESTKPLD